MAPTPLTAWTSRSEWTTTRSCPQASRAVFRLPWWGGLKGHGCARSLATLLAGGTPLVPSLEVAIAAVGNRYVRSRLAPTTTAVSEGRGFHEALEESEVVTDIAIDMIKVGESTGALDEMLGEVSDFLDEEVEMRQERILSLVEPVMLVIMGAIIATLLIAMYLPMFTAWEQMG